MYLNGCSKLTIKCESGSAAEEYAKKYGINYKYNVPETVVRGDLNGDGRLTGTDLLKLKKIIVGIDILAEDEKNVADLNEDGKITATDLLILKQLIVGLI